MKREQIERFIKKFNLDAEIRYYRDNAQTSYFAFADSISKPPRIFLNMRWTKCKTYTCRNGLYVKCSILHELGHIKYHHCGSLQDFKPELIAHLFAIKISGKFKMWKIRRGLLCILRGWGTMADKYPTYYDAYENILKDKKWVRKYGRIYKSIQIDAKNLKKYGEIIPSRNKERVTV